MRKETGGSFINPDNLQKTRKLIVDLRKFDWDRRKAWQDESVFGKEATSRIVIGGEECQSPRI